MKLPTLNSIHSTLRFGRCLFGSWAFALLLATPAIASERYAVIVSGASGGEKYAEQQQKWRASLAASLKARFVFADANLMMLDEVSEGSSKANADNVRRVMGDLRRRATRDDTIFLVLLGHGTFDGADAKFNLVGPDLSAAEWKGLLDGISGRVVFVDTTEASFPFLDALSSRGRVVITATDSAMQRFATVFPEYFILALADVASDLDRNGRVSVWEAFAAASAGVRRHYERRGQLSTERPLLDDNGDREGRDAEAPGDDGTIARTIFLDPAPGTGAADAAVAALERQRVILETQIEDLKARKPTLSEAEYQAELEKLLLQLARVAQQIRQGS